MRSAVLLFSRCPVAAGVQKEWMKHARAPERQRQKLEIRVAQFAAPLEQPHSDEKEPIGKKRTTHPRHGVRIQHRGRDEQRSLTTRQAADLANGGPRYLLELTSGKYCYKQKGRYKVAVKVIDIFRNDTTKVVETKI